MAFTKEVVEFGWKGLSELKSEVKSTGEEMERMRKSNTKLTQSLSNGRFEKYGKQLRNVREELKGVRQEEERLQRLATKQRLQGTHGRFLGSALYYGQRLGGAGGMLHGAVSGIGSGLGAIGVGLGVGALAQRGLSGTATEARLGNAVDRLSRVVASDLAPMVEKLTNVIAGISESQMRIDSGKGTLGDKATAYGFKGAAYGLAALVGLRLAGISPKGVAIGAGNMAMAGAGRADQLLTKPPVVPFKAAAPLSRVAKIGGAAGPIAALVGLGIQTYADSDKHEHEFGMPRVGTKNTYSDLRRPHKLAGLGMNLYAGMPGMPFVEGFANTDNQRWLARQFGYSNKEFNQHLGIGSESNKKFQPLMVQGAGERRSAGDLYEELATTIPTKMLNRQKEEEASETEQTMAEIRDTAQTIADIIGPVASLITRIFG